MEMRRVAIDPGEVHCGVALFLGADCYDCYEGRPATVTDTVQMWVESRAIDELVVESFHLYPGKAHQQSFSQMFTCEVIGVMRWLARGGGVPFITQPASIKKPTSAILRAKGIKLKSVGKGQHVTDAEWHGWYRVFNPTKEAGETWI
jgi:hypothetical protein